MHNKLFFLSHHSYYNFYTFGFEIPNVGVEFPSSFRPLKLVNVACYSSVQFSNQWYCYEVDRGWLLYIYNKTIKEKEDSLLEIVTLFTQTLRLVHIYIVWVKCLMWIWVSRFRFNSRNIIFCEWHWETIVTVVLAPYKNDILIYLFGCPCSKDILFKGV